MRWLRLFCSLLGIWMALTAAAQDDYVAEDGFFSLPLPEGWQSGSSSNGLLLERGGVRMHLLALPADSPQQAIDDAFGRLGIEPGALIGSTDAPLPNGVWKQNIHAAGSYLNIGLAQLLEGRALAVVIEGEQSAIQPLNPQIVRLLGGIKLGELPLPPYVDAAAFDERAVEFGAAPYVLSGTLSLPAGSGPFAAVVVVHGSGPQDRDGSLGALAAYRDIAQGLAGRGFAVLRYDKRTFTYAAQLQIDADFTVDSESTDDALYAVDFLRGQPEIDAARVFVLGHSLGASVTPRILTRDSAIAGGILLAASTRSFSDLLRGQVDYLREVNPTAFEGAAAEGLLGIIRSYDAVAAGADAADAFGAQAAYFQSLEVLDPLGTAQQLRQPLLILQGERDYQVTMADFAGWQSAFADSARVALISYPLLNHQFMAQGDPARLSIPQDYALPDFVAAAVIDDIAGWLAGQS